MEHEKLAIELCLNEQVWLAPHWRTIRAMLYRKSEDTVILTFEEAEQATRLKGWQLVKVRKPDDPA